MLRLDRRALEAAGLTDAFAELSSQNRYAILHRVQTAKKAETRGRRIAKYVGMLAAGETPHERRSSGARRPGLGACALVVLTTRLGEVGPG